MKVTGYKLREALRRWQLRRDTAAGQFEKSLKAFPGEDKAKPDDIVQAVTDAETAIAKLQVAQSRYNANVGADVPGYGHLTVLHCVKLVGGIARVEKMWRGVAGAGGKKDRTHYFGVDPSARKADEVRAEPTITPDQAGKKAEAIGRVLASLREAIATANATERDIEDLDPALFE